MISKKQLAVDLMKEGREFWASDSVAAALGMPIILAMHALEELTYCYRYLSEMNQLGEYAKWKKKNRRKTRRK